MEALESGQSARVEALVREHVNSTKESINVAEFQVVGAAPSGTRNTSLSDVANGIPSHDHRIQIIRRGDETTGVPAASPAVPDRPFPACRPAGRRGAADLLAELERRAVSFVVLTNGSAFPPAEQAAKLRGLGLAVCDDGAP